MHGGGQGFEPLILHSGFCVTASRLCVIDSGYETGTTGSPLLGGGMAKTGAQPTALTVSPLTNQGILMNLWRHLMAWVNHAMLNFGSALSNLYHTVLPPQWDHSPDTVKSLSESNPKDEFLYGIGYLKRPYEDPRTWDWDAAEPDLSVKSPFGKCSHIGIYFENTPHGVFWELSLMKSTEPRQGDPGGQVSVRLDYGVSPSLDEARESSLHAVGTWF